MKLARVCEVIGTVVVGVACYMVHINTIYAAVVAIIGLMGILTGIQIEEAIREDYEPRASR